MIKKIAILAAALAVATPSFALVIDRTPRSGGPATAQVAAHPTVGHLSHPIAARQPATRIEWRPAPKNKKRR
jgi:hypothetical protein